MKNKYVIRFYADSRGCEPVGDVLEELKGKTDKTSRINLSKIYSYLILLEECGFTLGEPYIKHIEGDIWELRPIRNRIFFFCFNGDKMVMLHHFVKKTQKTPQREIEQAKRKMLDYIERKKQEG